MRSIKNIHFFKFNVSVMLQIQINKGMIFLYSEGVMNVLILQ